MKLLRAIRPYMFVATLAVPALLTLVPLVTLAATSIDGVIILQPISGFVDGTEVFFNGNKYREVNDIGGYLDGIYKLGIASATGLAVVMGTIGGVEYMASAAVQGKLNGIDKIQCAIWGLVLALGSFLILQTINPALVRFDFIDAINRVSAGAPPSRPPGSGGQPPADETATRNDLASFGILVNKPPCPSGSNGQGCTNVGDLPAAAINGVIALANACGPNCTLTITGGTEPGHKTHGVGKPFLDLSHTTTPSGWLDNYITQNGTFVRQTCLGALYSFNGNEYLDEQGSASHWHSCFGTSCKFDPGC